MICFRIRSVVIKLDFSFFAVIALYIFFDTTSCGIMGILACLCHETGHIVMLALKKKKIDAIDFYGGGMRISHSLRNVPLVVLAGGCAVNFALFAVFVFICGDGLYTAVFGFINLFVGLFNLMPLKTLDGGQLLEKVLIRALRTERALKISDIAEIVGISVIFFILTALCFMNIVGISVIMMIFYLVFVDILAKM